MYLYLLVFVCLYFDVLHSLHVVCRLVYLTHFHFCTQIHAVVIICVCQIFIKETACLLVLFLLFLYRSSIEYGCNAIDQRIERALFGAHSTT